MIASRFGGESTSEIPTADLIRPPPLLILHIYPILLAARLSSSDHEQTTTTKRSYCTWRAASESVFDYGSMKVVGYMLFAGGASVFDVRKTG